MRQILQQTFWLFLAQSITRVIGFFYTIFLARNLGVSDFGLFSAAFAYFSLVLGVVDFGLNRFLILQISLNKLKTPELLANITVLRLTAVSILFALFSLILYFLDPDKLRVHITLLLILAVLPASLAQTFDGVFVALHKLKYSAIPLTLVSLITASLGFYLIASGVGVIGAVIALIVGQLAYFVMLGTILINMRISFIQKVTLNTLKNVLLSSFPYGILTFLGLIYFKIDTILLSYLKGNFDTGIYTVGYRFLEISIILPSALASVFFPVFAKWSKEIAKLYKRGVLILVILSFVTMGIFVFILPPILQIFLPQYVDSLKVIRILTLSIPFFFVNSLQSMLLLSRKDLLKKLIYISIFIIFINISLNLLFIPKYSYLAASWVTLISEIFIFLVFFVLTKRFLKI